MFKVQLKRDWQLLDYSVNSRLQGRYEQRQYEGLRPTINSARKEFHEDNEITVNNFLTECHDKALKEK